MIRLLAGLAASLLALSGSAARTTSAATANGSSAGYGWPLRPGPDRIIRDFDPPLHPWLAGNRGLDLAGTAGQEVRAANSGIVSFAGQVGGLGAVSVTFGALRTTYEPVAPSVRQGVRVEVGDVIGRLQGNDLHWGLLRGTDYLDPLALLGLEQVRLLPNVPA